MSKRKQHIERKNKTSRNKTTIKKDIWIETHNKVRVEGPDVFTEKDLCLFRVEVSGFWFGGLSFRVSVSGFGFLGFRVQGFRILDIWESQKGKGGGEEGGKMAKSSVE